MRDDELARQCNVEESQEDEESGPMSAMKIELAPSETKPYTRWARYGYQFITELQSHVM